MNDCSHKYEELDGCCLQCGLSRQDRQIDDLKARIKAVRAVLGAVVLRQPYEEALQRITNLRVTNWKKNL